MSSVPPSIAELEKRMRPGAMSQVGFLGPTESLKAGNLSQMIYRVLAYAERRVLLDVLLTEVEAAYPEAYAWGKPYE